MAEYTLSIDVRSDEPLHEVVTATNGLARLLDQAGLTVHGLGVSRWSDDEGDDHDLEPVPAGDAAEPDGM